MKKNPTLQTKIFFKKFFSLIFVFFSLLSSPFANGVCIINIENDEHLTLISSDINVSVNNQVATVKVTQSFRNNSGMNTEIKFAYPMSETASALSLLWQNNNEWFAADFSPSPQDTILPGDIGGSVDGSLIRQYLGDYPLYFDLEQIVFADSIITFELTYVDLLPYSFNIVEFLQANDYDEIQSEPLESMLLNFKLYSDRTIDWIDLLDYSSEQVVNNGNEATLTFSETDVLANADLLIQYQLNASELGLFSFSTYIPDSLLSCDEEGKGFMAFIVEPDPSTNTDVINKIFTLIIDRSGSMTGTKMQQARDAAIFITENLNAGDEFNIIAFDDEIISFKPDHVPYNLTTEAEALNFIAGLERDGLTNISGAFSEAIPDFANSDPDKAKIIIFFTDGEATFGITETQGILDHIKSEINTHAVEDLSIFTFGIGEGANEQLLTLIAFQNNGHAEFLGVEELLTKITEFYLTIQNPVLLNTEMFFTPDLVSETYPAPLPNLFKGQQLIVVGRYDVPADVNVNLSGTAFGETVEYDYDISLVDTINPELQFLPRLWAKQKIRDLTIQFFSANPDSPEAEALEDSIVDISLCYGVISAFTSFSNNSDPSTGGPVSIVEFASSSAGEVALLECFPNPFVRQTSFKIDIPTNLMAEELEIEIWTADGVLIKTMKINGNGKDERIVSWDGFSDTGLEVAPGIYFIQVKIKNQTFRTKVVKGS